MILRSRIDVIEALNFLVLAELHPPGTSIDQ